jgi:hypothetical protein
MASSRCITKLMIRSPYFRSSQAWGRRPISNLPDVFHRNG